MTLTLQYDPSRQTVMDTTTRDFLVRCYENLDGLLNVGRRPNDEELQEACEIIAAALDAIDAQDRADRSVAA